MLFVRRGTRPGLFAPKEDVTQFKWSMAGGPRDARALSAVMSGASAPAEPAGGPSPDEPPISVS